MAKSRNIRSRETREPNVIQEIATALEQTLEQSIELSEPSSHTVEELIVSAVIQASVSIVNSLPHRHVTDHENIIDSHIRSHLKLAKRYIAIYREEFKG
jgi:hypothetical protein